MSDVLASMQDRAMRDAAACGRLALGAEGAGRRIELVRAAVGLAWHVIMMSPDTLRLPRLRRFRDDEGASSCHRASGIARLAARMVAEASLCERLRESDPAFGRLARELRRAAAACSRDTTTSGLAAGSALPA